MIRFKCPNKICLSSCVLVVLRNWVLPKKKGIFSFFRIRVMQFQDVLFVYVTVIQYSHVWRLSNVHLVCHYKNTLLRIIHPTTIGGSVQISQKVIACCGYYEMLFFFKYLTFVHWTMSEEYKYCRNISICTLFLGWVLSQYFRESP